MRLGTVELGCFRLKEVLGRGSYGTAFLAEQEGFNRDAVIKIAHASLLGGRNDDLVRARFAAELQAATRVTHPNVITLFTAGETSDGVPAIAMEYVPGPTLEELLEQRAGELPPGLLHNVFSQFGRAVSAFHRASVTHRDLSPTNIVLGNDVDGDLRLKVLDFGVAKTGVDRGRTSVVGSPRYMAPEQVVGTSGPESDVYALGAILWWALCGEEFQSEVQTLEDVTEVRLMGARDRDIRDIAPTVPAPVADLVREMVSFETAGRPSAAEFCERWEACRPTAEPATTGLAHPTPFPMDPVESFFGEAPELIADIVESLETHDAHLARTACTQLSVRAEELGSSRLTAAANAFAEFVEAGDFTRAAGFKEQIEHEYGVLFRRLMLQR